MDNATAFKSRKFKKAINEFGILTQFSTPYVQTPIGKVERGIRTLESYIKQFLLENNTHKHALRRAIKLMRFSECAPLKMSPFEKLTGCKPRNRITNNLGLDNPDLTLVTLVKSPNEELKIFVNEQVKNRKRKVRKFVLEKNRKKGLGLEIRLQAENDK